MKKTVVLIILDGWGIGRADDTNPIYIANPPFIDYIKRNYRAGALQASGIAVGLPWGEEGNSEVGHLTIGAGKVLYQHYPRISLAIKDKSFFENKALAEAFGHAQKNNSGMNLVGLLTEGSVHASFEHLEALLESAARHGVKNLKLHLFTDGKDSTPRSAPALLQKLRTVIERVGAGTIASIGGRYYGMDRDGHYDRTKKAYDAILGRGTKTENAVSWITRQYAAGLEDEFVEPATLVADAAAQKNDAIIFFNFREDSMRQLSEAFIAPDFRHFSAEPPSNFFTVTFTEYNPTFNVPVAFPQEHVVNPLGKVLADNGLVQLRIAETEKYAHVTYFFNGLISALFKNEYRILVPSQNIARQDEHPEMMAGEIANRVIQAVEERGTDFILANFANPDMVAHTGNMDATVEAVRAVDRELGRIIDACGKNSATLIVTSDHGNAERLRNPQTGTKETAHDPSPVPLYIVGEPFVSPKNDVQIKESETQIAGVLSDIAPTILDIMDIPKPPEMTGESLLDILT